MTEYTPFQDHRSVIMLTAGAPGCHADENLDFFHQNYNIIDMNLTTESLSQENQ